jgi:hypothetical protein
MSFTKLKDRIAGLPLVLAGPMVRRVQPDALSVWIAVRRRRRVRLEIYDSTGAVIAKGERDTRIVGENLHLACVTARPASPLAAGTVCEYNLFFDHIASSDDIPSGSSLFGPRIVSAAAAAAAADAEARAMLTYAADGGPARPSFVLPPSTLDALRLLHGSCRKEAGEHGDAFEAADHILRQSFRGTERRPHLVFLTGDNIYNDGCTVKSFETVLDAAPTLLGWDESMPASQSSPIPEGEQPEPRRPIKLSELSNARWSYSLDDAGLSAPGAELRQLFGLGETCTLYLLAFSDVLWPPDLDYQRGTFDFRGTLPAARRAFANLASYMIFDDHEFTNSWNLTADWVESVLESRWGPRIYQNALAAYALCCGWGNTPERFESGAGKALFDAVEQWAVDEIAGNASPPDPVAVISASVGLPSAAAFRNVRDWSGFHGDDVVRWDYTVPCPNLNVVVLDAYMWRSYEGSFDNCLVIGQTGLEQQIGQAAMPETDCSLFVVSNVAINVHGGGGHLAGARGWRALMLLAHLLFPVWLVARLIWLLIGLFKTSWRWSLPSFFSLVRAWMYEPEFGSSYQHQSEGFERLMAHVTHRTPQVTGGKRQSRVVFLSGDVHQAFCMRMEYWSRVPLGVNAAPVEGVVAQLVASPCKWVNPRKLDLKRDARVHHWAGWTTEPTLTWNNQPDTSPWRFKKSPWMMEYVPAASEPRMNPDPEWRYALATVAPDPSPSRLPLDIPDRAAPTLDDQLEEMENISVPAIWDLEQSHVLKVNNLADVTFDWTAGSRAVVQRVWWRGRPSIDREWTVNRYVVPMEPPTSPPPLPR